jgi:hypothetical protein
MSTVDAVLGEAPGVQFHTDYLATLLAVPVALRDWRNRTANKATLSRGPP